MVVDIYADDLRRVLTFLNRNRFTFLLRRMSSHHPAAMTTSGILVMALYDWFAHLGDYISDDQQQRVIDKFSGALTDVAEHAHLKSPAVLTLSDGRYAAVQSHPAWYDYELDVELQSLPEAAVTHIACDLTALLARVEKRVADLRGGKDAAAEREQRTN